MLLPNVSTMLVNRAGTAVPARGDITRAERNELADVLAEGAVEPGFQPIVELATRRVVGWEALARGPRGSEPRASRQAVRRGARGTAGSTSSTASASASR